MSGDRDSLTNTLERLERLSLDLREAMVARDPERILELADRQNEVRELAMSNGMTDTLRTDDTMRTAVDRLTRLQESNRLIASAFLGIYRGALRTVSPGHRAAPTGIYGRHGDMTVGTGAILVEQTG